MMMRATFIGVRSEFENSLRTWLAARGWLDECTVLSKPQANHTIFCDAPADRVEQIADALSKKDFPDYFYLALLPPTKGEQWERTIANPSVGDDNASMSQRIRMHGEGRKVGVLPAVLAGRKGW
jgi:hypothetical protein